MEQRHIIDALAELRAASSDVYGCMRRETGVWYMAEPLYANRRPTQRQKNGYTHWLYN